MAHPFWVFGCVPVLATNLIQVVGVHGRVLDLFPWHRYFSLLSHRENMPAPEEENRTVGAMVFRPFIDGLYATDATGQVLFFNTRSIVNSSSKQFHNTDHTRGRQLCTDHAVAVLHTIRTLV